MNKLIRLISGITLLSGVAFGQSNETTFATPSSSLSIDSRTNEERIEFLMNLANAYVKEEDYDSAINAYERIIEIDPTHLEARYIVAHVYINGKQYAKAETSLLALIADYPEDFKLLNNLAWLYATAEDPEFRNGKKAVKLAQEAMLIEPNDHHVWSTLSEAHYVCGDYEKAYRDIQHMAALAARFGNDITKESVESYNEQIRKCKRAMDTEAVLKGEPIQE